MNIVVTGAGKGIGAEIVKRLDSNTNHQIFAISRNQENLQALDDITSDRTSIFPLDLCSKEVGAMCNEFFERHEKIDVLINNAGQLINKEFLYSSADDFLKQYHSNVISAVNIIQALHAKMKKSEHAHIINISSMGGFTGSSKFPGLSAYSSSKGALCILTECLAEEFKSDGIKVNALALGAVQTQMLENAFPGYNAGMPADKMAHFIVDFALEGQKYFNGKILPVSSSTP